LIFRRYYNRVVNKLRLKTKIKKYRRYYRKFAGKLNFRDKYYIKERQVFKLFKGASFLRKKRFKYL
jgi:hypothetical protein